MGKRFLAIALSLAISVTMSGCGSGDTPEDTTEHVSTQATDPVASTPPVSTQEETQTPSHTPDETQEEFAQLEIKESGYAMNDEYLYCAVILHNPNENLCVDFPKFRVTARDKDGLLLGTRDQTLSVIYPNQDFCYAGQCFEVEETPASVDIEVVPPDDYNIENVDLVDHPEYKPLSVTNTVTRSDKVMGEVVNENDYEIEDAIVTVVFRDENDSILAGTSTFVDKIPAHGSIPFDMRIKHDFVTENYEAYANIW